MSEQKEKRRLTKSERNTRKEKIISFIILFIVSVLFAFPLIYMLGASFKSPTDIVLHPEKIFPSPGEWTLEHYTGFIWRDGAIDKMPIWMLNSLWSSFATVGLTVLIDLVTAYVVVFMKFKGKNAFIKFLLLWMAVPAVIGTVSSFAMYATMRNALNITSGIGAYIYIYMWIIVPGITGIFNLLLMRNFFLSIPHEIIESARGDGASNAQIFFKIVVPLAKSTIMLIVLFTFIGAWNNLTWPQLLFSGENEFWQTVTVALVGYTGGNSWGTIGVQMATSVFSMIPILIIFVITQNKMIDGLASTGIKM